MWAHPWAMAHLQRSRLGATGLGKLGRPTKEEEAGRTRPAGAGPKAGPAKGQWSQGGDGWIGLGNSGERAGSENGRIRARGPRIWPRWLTTALLEVGSGVVELSWRRISTGLGREQGGAAGRPARCSGASPAKYGRGGSGRRNSGESRQGCGAGTLLWAAAAATGPVRARDGLRGPARWEAARWTGGTSWLEESGGGATWRLLIGWSEVEAGRIRRARTCPAAEWEEARVRSARGFRRETHIYR